MTRVTTAQPVTWRHDFTQSVVYISTVRSLSETLITMLSIDYFTYLYPTGVF